jgi:hypothetical protein
MLEPVTGRARHFHDSLLRPLWSWIAVGLVGVLGTGAWLRDEFLDAEHQRRLQYVNFLPHWPWHGWALALVSCLVVVLFEGSYRVRKTIDVELEELRDRLAKIGLKRPVYLGQATFDISVDAETGNNTLKSLSFLVHNSGDDLMTYHFQPESFKLNGVELTDDSSSDWSFVGPGSQQGFRYEFLAKPEIWHNDILVAQFWVETDNVPPVSVRRSFHKIKYDVVRATNPVRIIDGYLDRREE